MSPMLKCVVSIALVVFAVGCGTRAQPSGQHKEHTVNADTPAEIRDILQRLNSADPLERAYGTRLLGESGQSADSAERASSRTRLVFYTDGLDSFS